MMVENIDIFRALCKTWRPEWQGMVMAELSYAAGKRTAPLDIQVKEGRLVKIVASYGEAGERMEMLLFHAKGNNRSYKMEREGDFWQSFDAPAVREFSLSLGDHNEIHQGERPIVSGFQLLWTLRQKISASSMKIRFHSSIYAGENVYVKQDEDAWKGYTDHLCFTCWVSACPK